jgi:hypothetical protein
MTVFVTVIAYLLVPSCCVQGRARSSYTDGGMICTGSFLGANEEHIHRCHNLGNLS